MPKITDNGIDYFQQQVNEEHEREAKQIQRYDRSLRDISDKLLAVEQEFYELKDSRTGKQSIALQKAIDAINAYQEKRRR